MCAMVNDAKDLTPYLLDTIAPCLARDAAPEVRTVASKALVMLVKGLGQSHSSHLVPSLLQTIESESSSVELSGSAQGLCEVLVKLGPGVLNHGLRDEILPIAPPKATAHCVLAFLPPALGKGFSPCQGAPDDRNLFDDIRESSISFLGDLLYHDSGTQMVVMCAHDDEDGAATGSAAGEKAMLEILSKPRRDAVLAALYMMRSFTSAVVRQSTLQVPPKTLQSMLETLMQALSGKSVEKQNVAPAGTRQGVCLELAEVIQCSPRRQLDDSVETLVVALEDSMCYRSFDELIPRLLKRITSVDDLVQEYALAGLRNVKVKSRVVLP
ncbi:hypothetical protein SPRG_18101, partial [Saprolegnia parasitica CBS 223.65]